MDGPPVALNEAPRPAEQLLMQAAHLLPPSGVVLCGSLGRAQLARQLAETNPNRDVVCHYYDAYHAHQAEVSLKTLTLRHERLHIHCNSDITNLAADAVAWPVSRGGEAELTRDTLQAACVRLRLGGTLLAAVDQPRDHWLHNELLKLGLKTKALSQPQGVVYHAVKTAEPRRLRDFSCEFAFRDQDQLIYAHSRPGVFSHRRLDLGARKLLDALTVSPGERVLEIGCGSGAIALAAASRDESVTVHAVDSFTRSVDCTLSGAARNGLTNITAEVCWAGPAGGAKSYTLAVANPPYYANFRIAETFLTIADRCLVPGGRLLLVTQNPEWYWARLPGWFADVRFEEAKKYTIVQARKRHA